MHDKMMTELQHGGVRELHLIPQAPSCSRPKEDAEEEGQVKKQP